MTHGLTSLADYDRSGMGNHCAGDGIALPNLSAAQGLIAVDACGQPIVAAFAPAEGPRVVLDGNMARFYTTKPADWFNRIVNWLALGTK